ncbi:MAG: diguanylate cyclase, partial [Rhodoferax sp.]
MKQRSVFLWNRIGRLNQGLDQLLYAFSAYALPIFLGLASLLALFALKTQFPVVNPQALEIRVVKGSVAQMEPVEALAQLRDNPVNPFHDTQLSQAPFWLSFVVPKDVERSPLMVEFPSRHATDIACWDAKSLNLLGSGNRQETKGDISVVKAGFALALDPALKDGQVLCRTSAIGPARLSALAWPAAALETSAQEFHRKSGLLDGGIIVLAIFVLITALINRNALYILFSAWLVVNLRMGAHSAGWDSQWLGNSVPQDWLLGIRPITLAMYYMLTITLFKALFRDDLTKVGSLALMRVAQWTCLPLLLLSAVMPYQSFLPLLWVSTGLSTSILVYFLTRILQKTRSRVAMWYSASIAIT